MYREHERELLIRWRQGDQAAADELWRFVCAKISGPLRRQVDTWNKAVDVDDLLQQAWIVARDHVLSGKYDVNGRGGFSTWCYIVCKNRLRKIDRRPPARPLPDDPPGPVGRFPAEEFMGDLEKAIQKLPNTQEEPLRRVFCLRYGVNIVNGKAECCGKVTESEALRVLKAELGISHDRNWLYRMITRAKQRVVREMSGYLDR